jgi:hypothetical protein
MEAMLSLLYVDICAAPPNGPVAQHEEQDGRSGSAHTLVVTARHWNDGLFSALLTAG